MADRIRLSVIDDSNRGNHWHLQAGDTCLYLFEYTSGQNFLFSATNQLISNLKKKPSTANQNEIWYKNRDITRCAEHFRRSLNQQWLASATLVPVPGSKALGHPDFDNRMEQVCRQICQPPADVRSIVRQRDSTIASHEAGDGHRTTLPELLALYDIDEAVCQPEPTVIAIVDDVLTAGTHYRAMHIKLSQRFPNVPLFGLFVARRVFAPGEADNNPPPLPPL